MSTADCGRAAGHEGPHRTDDDCQEQRVLAEVRRIAAALRSFTDRLSWGLLTLRADAGVTDAGALAGELRVVHVRLGAAVASLATLGAVSAPAGGGGSD